MGIGDDCALLRIPRGRDLLLTTDFSLEGVHFRREWHPPESVGHRCLARGLSDIAATGGDPLAAFLSLALPDKLQQRWVDGFLRGLLLLAKRHGVTLAGGDTSQSPDGVLADIVVVGSTPSGRALLRSGAKPGDIIYVTGRLGRSAAAIRQMYANPRDKLLPRRYREHFFPEPRIEVGRELRQRNIVSAMIDVSDGLSTDLAHICDESGVGARIFAAAVPHPRGAQGLQFALSGGDDYELLFTARPRKVVPASIAGVPITKIGEITRARSVMLVEGKHENPLPPRGWQHFARK
jgi:thiamine-monophosphate kinase